MHKDGFYLTLHSQSQSSEDDNDSDMSELSDIPATATQDDNLLSQMTPNQETREVDDDGIVATQYPRDVMDIEERDREVIPATQAMETIEESEDVNETQNEDFGKELAHQGEGVGSSEQPLEYPPTLPDSDTDCVEATQFPTECNESESKTGEEKEEKQLLTSDFPPTLSESVYGGTALTIDEQGNSHEEYETVSSQESNAEKDNDIDDSTKEGRTFYFRTQEISLDIDDDSDDESDSDEEEEGSTSKGAEDDDENKPRTFYFPTQEVDLGAVESGDDSSSSSDGENEEDERLIGKEASSSTDPKVASPSVEQKCEKVRDPISPRQVKPSRRSRLDVSGEESDDSFDLFASLDDKENVGSNKKAKLDQASSKDGREETLLEDDVITVDGDECRGEFSLIVDDSAGKGNRAGVAPKAPNVLVERQITWLESENENSCTSLPEKKSKGEQPLMRSQTTPVTRKRPLGANNGKACATVKNPGRRFSGSGGVGSSSEKEAPRGRSVNSLKSKKKEARRIRFLEFHDDDDDDGEEDASAKKVAEDSEGDDPGDEDYVESKGRKGKRSSKKALTSRPHVKAEKTLEKDSKKKSVKEGQKVNLFTFFSLKKRDDE